MKSNLTTIATTGCVSVNIQLDPLYNDGNDPVVFEEFAIGIIWNLVDNGEVWISIVVSLANLWVHSAPRGWPFAGFGCDDESMTDKIGLKLSVHNSCCVPSGKIRTAWQVLFLQM